MQLPPITPKQKEILYYLYKFRFLTTNHFQKLLNHKDPHRIKEWLHNLIENGYINREYSRKTYGETQQAARYWLGLKARHFLKTDKRCDLVVLNRVYKEKKRTKTFINNCLYTADLYLFFLTQKKGEETLHFFTESEIFKYTYFPEVKPSAYIAMKSPSKIRRYFLEVFSPGTPAAVLRYKVRMYISYMESGQWEANTKCEPVPAILFICPTERIKKHIYYYAKALFEKAYEEKIGLYLTSPERITIPKNAVWEKVSLV